MLDKKSAWAGTSSGAVPETDPFVTLRSRLDPRFLGFYSVFDDRSDIIVPAYVRDFSRLSNNVVQ